MVNGINKGQANGVARTFSGAPWEKTVGYCRAVRKGAHIWVAGCAPVRADGSVFAPRNAERQAARCIAVAEQALQELGSGLRDVVRTRIYVTDIADWDAIARAHAAAFAQHPPAATMVQVAALIDPLMLVEIEVDAFAE